MLFELYQYVTTPCPRYVRDMGYLKEIIGMGARHRRCASAWSGHLQASRDWIGQAIERTPRRGQAVVLGSGLLADVPVDQLADSFDRVVFVDILHLPVIKRALKAYDNVELISCDVTGVAESLHQGMISEEHLPTMADIPLAETDLVVSLNILSQLPIVPMEYAAKKNRLMPPGFATSLLSAHLQALSEAPGKVCLITEVEQQLCDAQQVIEKADPLEGQEIPEKLKARSTRWEWQFAPYPEKHPTFDLVYQVEGYLSE